MQRHESCCRSRARAGQDVSFFSQPYIPDQFICHKMSVRLISVPEATIGRCSIRLLSRLARISSIGGVGSQPARPLRLASPQGASVRPTSCLVGMR